VADIDLTPLEEVREHLATIRRGWRHVLDPIKTSGGGATQRTERPATEDELELPPDARLDTPVTLAFWVHAALDEWPTILQTLQPGPDGNLRLVTTETVDCADVEVMAALLHREAPRLAEWVDGGHDFGATFVTEMGKLARAVSRVAWPPKGDRMTIGECPACTRRVRVKAPVWHRVPQPTTDPAEYPAWSEWQPDRDKPIACRCGIEDNLEGWQVRMAGPSLLLTAEQLVADIRQQFGLKYEALTIRTWQRRGMVRVAGYSDKGHALYDRTQVLAALMDREKKRDVAS
jgi:hypothetical protein